MGRLACSSGGVFYGCQLTAYSKREKKTFKGMMWDDLGRELRGRRIEGSTWRWRVVADPRSSFSWGFVECLKSAKQNMKRKSFCGFSLLWCDEVWDSIRLYRIAKLEKVWGDSMFDWIKVGAFPECFLVPLDELNPVNPSINYFPTRQLTLPSLRHWATLSWRKGAASPQRSATRLDNIILRSPSPLPSHYLLCIIFYGSHFAVKVFFLLYPPLFYGILNERRARVERKGRRRHYSEGHRHNDRRIEMM